MIWASIAARLLSMGIPKRLHKVVMWLAFVLLCAALFGLWLWQHDRGVIEEHEAEVTEQVGKLDDDGDLAASEAAADKKAGIEKENEDARKAADGSDDPLKSGLDRLR